MVNHSEFKRLKSLDIFQHYREIYEWILRLLEPTKTFTDCHKHSLIFSLYSQKGAHIEYLNKNKVWYYSHTTTKTNQFILPLKEQGNAVPKLCWHEAYWERRATLCTALQISELCKRWTSVELCLSTLTSGWTAVWHNALQSRKVSLRFAVRF